MLLFLALNISKKLQSRGRIRTGNGQADLICRRNYVPTTSLPATLHSRLCGQWSCDGGHCWYGDVFPEYDSHMSHNVSVAGERVIGPGTNSTTINNHQSSTQVPLVRAAICLNDKAYIQLLKLWKSEKYTVCRILKWVSQYGIRVKGVLIIFSN